MRIELTTSSLPRKCSTTELQRLIGLWGKYPKPKERKTRFEPATYSLEGCRSTNWATPAFVLFPKPIPKNKLYSTTKFRLCLWAKAELTLVGGQERIRTSEVERQRIYSPPHLAALESARVKTNEIKLAMLTLLSHLSESNQRPTDYKSVALPAELKWHLKNCPVF